jgi:RluA family pseudouridine synthase
MTPIYEDNHLLVVDKPPGLLSQADRTGDQDVLTLWKQYVKKKYDKPGAVYLGLVHRLDRPVSGLMVLARTSKAAARLSLQFKQRTVRKEYLAIVEARPSTSGTLTDYLIKENRRVRIATHSEDGSKVAELDLSVFDSVGKETLVGLRLHTGRSHQIRVQLASRGCPILGDMKYGAQKELDGRNLALHSFRLAFEHPTQRIPMSFHARVPDSWPTPFRKMVLALPDPL